MITEQLKREMGLHNDEQRRSHGFLDAKWTARCNELMAEDSRFLLQFDKLKSAVKMVFGNNGYLLNPFQIVCPICMEIKILSSMNQLLALSQHLSKKHLECSRGNSIKRRLAAWIENNFITEQQLDNVEKIPGVLFASDDMIATPQVRAMVRAMVLAHDISLRALT